MREAERKPWQAYPRISCNDVRKMAKLNLLKHVLELQLVSISTCDREKKNNYCNKLLQTKFCTLL